MMYLVADEARRLVLARISLVKSSDFVQETQQKINFWLGDLDSNQDSVLQRDESYH